jgi:hypothetical protein
MGWRRTRRIQARGDGTFRLRLSEHERALLEHVIPELRQLLAGDPTTDPRLRRLFPVAYPSDEEAESEYQRFMHEEIVASRLSAIDQVERTFRAERLDEAELFAWMNAINGIRLVLGTLLDVSEELDIGQLTEDDPNIEGFVLYDYLSMLLDEIVEALAG